MRPPHQLVAARASTIFFASVITVSLGTFSGMDGLASISSVAPQLAGHDFLKNLGVSLIPATAPDFFLEDTPTAPGRPVAAAQAPAAALQTLAAPAQRLVDCLGW